MIIVTGANGFIGSAMVWELNRRGHTDILAVDSVPLSSRNLLARNQYARFYGHNELLEELPKLKNIEWVIHMGACSSTTETNWDFLRENNLEYSKKIFEFCRHSGANLIYASSAATYGSGEKGFSDQTPPNLLKPLNLYGRSKLLFDEWVLEQNSTPSCWYGLKFFNVYGPHEYFKGPMASVAYKAFHQITKTGRLQLFRSHNPQYKDGEQLRDFVYVKDVVQWMAELMEKRPQNGIYNMGFGKARTWLDLASAVFSAINRPLQIDWIDIPESIRDQYQYFTEADMTKWKSIGMPSPRWSLEEGIHDYVKNYLQESDSLL
ncbi:MAG: ADP-glyceromanno-heptose 6-epimerase [Bdellovibrionaceae bacterium]|nr:ADP-glyceromanno-heptose 6-epimerase [Pseudobdellovibrionaceae bacterium]